MKTHTFYEHGFEFHLRDISAEKEGEIEPSRLETGSQNRGISNNVIETEKGMVRVQACKQYQIISIVLW